MPFIGSVEGTFGYGRSTTGPVTDQLQVYLTPTSYSGSGTTWDNLQNSTEATLFNSPSFSASTGFTLNGTTQYITMPDVTGITDFTQANNYTIEVWCRISSTQNDTATGDNDIVEKWNSGNELAYPYVCRYIRTTGNILFAVFNGTINPSVSFATTTDTWVQLVGVFDHTNTTLSAYRNGVFQTSGVMSIGGTISNSSTLNLGRRANSLGGGNNYFTGSVGILRIYSKALTADQISQNFSADRSRFGI
jgi:hypothetical protein